MRGIFSLILLFTALECYGANADSGTFSGTLTTEWLESSIEDGSNGDRDMRILESFTFIDKDGKEWEVPANAIVNGASIPRFLWPITGTPFVGEYRKASVVHDYYCKTKTESSDDVHRMFYEACLAGGVSKAKAETMYQAVANFGPKWKAFKGAKVDRKDDDLSYLRNLNIRSFEQFNDSDFNRRLSFSDPSQKGTGFNIPKKHKPVAFAWNDEDFKTKRWYPQGISGRHNPLEVNLRGPRFIAVSWYGKKKDFLEDQKFEYQHKGARVSFIDLKSQKYRHVLLVQSLTNSTKGINNGDYQQLKHFAPIQIHAGGIEWIGDYLYVVDTHVGIRVFDVTKIFRTESDPSKNRCGVLQGKAYAFNYRYALPQVALYKIDGAAPYSCLSAEYDGDKIYLWTGQYLKPNKGAPIITQYEVRLNGTSVPDLHYKSFKRPRDKDGNPVYNIQGLLRDDDKTWLAVSGKTLYKDSNARLITYKDGNPVGKRWRWPHGPEDFFFHPGSQRLWSLTEHIGQRLRDWLHFATMDDTDPTLLDVYGYA